MDGKKRTFLDVLNEPLFEQTLHDAGMFYVDYRQNIGSISNVCTELGFCREEMTSGAYHKRIHPDDYDNYIRLWNRFTRGQDDELYCEYRLKDIKGAWNWVLTHATVLKRDNAGRIEKLFGFDRIINRRKKAEEILHEQLIEEKRKTRVSEILFSAGADVVSDLHFSEKLDGGLEKMRDVIDFSSCSVYLKRDLSKPVHVYPAGSHVDIPRLDELMGQIVKSKYPIIEEVGSEECGTVMAVPLIDKNDFIGAFFLYHRKKGAYDGTDLYPVLSFADILTIAVQNREEMSGMVSDLEKDQLTGFLTRKSFDRTMNQIFTDVGQTELVVAMVDIDHFKRVNDTYGHQKGDEVISAIAGICSRTLRGNDILGRFGGEEFIILLFNTTGKNAVMTMDRIRRKIQAMEIPGIKIPVTVSVGVSIRSTDDTVNSLIKRADEALYDAKNSGRNRVEHR
nr:diguanylate cyclase [uncultured Sphaerochaeta sp.]